MMKSTHVFVAGTFDRLHAGHIHLLTEALNKADRITIGITSDTFIEKYKAIVGVESFLVRSQKVREWVRKYAANKNINIISIQDPYEPAASGDFDALIVTEDNRQTGIEINQKRKKKNLAELILIEIPLIPATDGETISSTRIRAGEIDTQGNLYLPESLRRSLKEPLGSIRSPDTISRSVHTIVTVGDVTTDTLLQNHIVPDLSIIDLHAKRKPYKQLTEFSFPEAISVVHVHSGPGFISQEALEEIKKWSITKPKTVMVVHGEDDLLVLPVVSLVSIGTQVYYGQPNVGLVEVIVDDTVKNKATMLLEQFTTGE